MAFGCLYSLVAQVFMAFYTASDLWLKLKPLWPLDYLKLLPKQPRICEIAAQAFMVFGLCEITAQTASDS